MYYPRFLCSPLPIPLYTLSANSNHQPSSANTTIEVFFNMASTTITTKILILSDTHGDSLQHPPPKADVAIHCGDLTEESKLHEFRAAITLLKSLDAPLKLVIAGNHDFTLDSSMFRESLQQIRTSIDDDALIERTYGKIGSARALLEADDVRKAGVVYLTEGSHRFALENGAVLTVYASPFTPSKSTGWGFQYDPDVYEHDWRIGEGVDIAVTHGPAKGVLDYADSKKRAGSSSLFAALARAKPKVHCFGHIHEAWGGKLVTWRDELSEVPSHFTDINHGESYLIESRATLQAGNFDSQEGIEEKAERRRRLAEQGCRVVDDTPIRPGEQTLFVNAAVEGAEDDRQQLPWLINVQLPKGVGSEAVVNKTRRRSSTAAVEAQLVKAVMV